MTDRLRKLSLRRRVSLAIWGINATLCLALLAFVLR